MPRPRKCRRVCRLPDNLGFEPLNQREGMSTVILNVDEYEAVRLIDDEGLSQEQCGEYMRIARTTVQQIYTTARRKLAQALVEGLPLRIEGGQYRLCEDGEGACGCQGCCRNRRMQPQEHKEAWNMKVAIPLDETKREVCVSFGRAPFFLFSDGEQREILENPAAEAEGGAGLKAAQFLVDQGATELVTVRCGENAGEVFQAAEIKIYKAAGTDLEENLQAWKEKKLGELTHFHAGFHGIR